MYLNKAARSIISKQLRSVYLDIKDEAGIGIVMGMNGLKMISQRLHSRSNFDGLIDNMDAISRSKFDQSEVGDLMDEDGLPTSSRLRLEEGSPGGIIFNKSPYSQSR